ncbi:MAG: hypothetical protein RIQ56_104 [Candidatus Parcubacteria bacterium]|jgi:D-alanine-D-alanine ligase-like ATP-grasp enzyme
MSKQYACLECGDAPISHRSARFTDQTAKIIAKLPLSQQLNTLALKIGAQIRSNRTFLSFAKNLLERLVSIGMVTKASLPNSSHSTRTLALYEGAKATNVTLIQYKLGSATLCYCAEKNDGSGRMIFFLLIPRPLGYNYEPVEWMDDKGILKKRLADAGLPHAPGGTADSFEQALHVFKSLGSSVVVKPHEGSRGRHTTLDVRTPEELKRAVEIAFEVTTEVVIEKYLKGIVHRVSLAGGEPVAVARREYPHVIGDGTHTLDELISLENQKPYRDGSFFKPLDREYRVQETLNKQGKGLTLLSIPKKGEKVILSDKNSRLHGTLTEDVTDTVHPENMKLFRRLAEVLDDPVVGVDFMCADVSKPWHEDASFGFLECNSMPFIDVHHRVVSGKTINVAAYVWDAVFPPLPGDTPHKEYLLDRTFA